MVFEIFIGLWCLNSIKEQNNRYYLQLVKEEARKLDDRFQLVKAYWTITSEIPEIKKVLAFRDKAKPETKTRALNHMSSIVKLTHAEFAFLMDPNGTCTLSTTDILLGHNYGFRTYFKDALTKGSGFLMAYGVTSHTLGFYFASRVTYQGKTVGVAVLKLSDKAMWPEMLLGAKKAPYDILHSPFNSLITKFGVIASPGPRFYVLDEISPELRRYLAETRQFPIKLIHSLGFPPGTWKALKSKGFLEAKNPDIGSKYFLFSVPLKAEGMELFYSIPEKSMMSIFKGVIRPIYLLLLVMFLSFLAMTVFFLSKEEKERRLEETYQKLIREHDRYVDLSTRYKRIIDTTQDGFWVLHPETRKIQEVNDSLCRVLGYSREELIGKTPFDLVDEENLKILKKQVSLSNDKCCDFEVELLKKDGSKRLFHVSSAFVAGDKPAKSFRFAFLTDITEKQEREKAIARKDAILEAVSEISSLVLVREMSEETVRQFLTLLGESGGIEKMFVVRIRDLQENMVSFTIAASWYSDGRFSVKRTTTTFRKDDPEAEPILQQLITGNVVYNPPLQCQRVLGFEEDSSSGLRCMIPIILDGKELWGAMVLESARGRRWMDIEMDAFKVAANLTAATIKRERFLREKRDREVKYTILVENSNSIICLIAPDGRILFLNKFGLKFFGYKPEEVIGKHVMNTIVPEKDSTGRNLRRMIERLLAEPERYPRGENENICSDGRRVWISWTNTPFRNEKGELVELMSVGHDITERKKIEEKLKEASEAKSMFLANMSHEIRTPLNAIIGMSQLLAESNLSREQAEFVSKIYSGGKALLSVLNNILDLAKIEAGKIEYQKSPFNLLEVMEHAVEIFSHQASEKWVDIYCHISPQVPMVLLGDAPKLGQIFRNLLSNALKFTHEGRVVFSASLDSQEGNVAMVTFEVSDTGEGIPKDKLETIFEPFSQADATVTRKAGGTGLGLTITREFILGMGGNVWIDSEEGKGTKVTLKIPFELEKEDKLSSEFKNLTFKMKEISQEWTALLVERDPWTKLVVKDTLERFNMKVIEAFEPEEIERKIKNEKKVLFIASSDPAHQEVLRMVEPPACILLLTREGVELRDEIHCEWLNKPILPTSLLKAVVQTCSESKKDKGHKEETKKSPAMKGAAIKGKVLLVEDTELNQALMQTILEKEGHEVTLAENGAEALLWLAEEEFDLVLMDIQMPVMDGLTTTRIIRSLEKGEDPLIPEEIGLSKEVKESLSEKLIGKSTPVIAITAHAFEEERQKIMEAGIDLYVSKPIIVEDFRRMIRRFFRKEPFVSESSEPEEASKDKKSEVQEGVKALKSYLMESYGLSEDEVPGFIEKAASSIRKNIEKAEEALEKGDYKTLQMSLHSLKGVLGSLGYQELMNAVKGLETKAKEREEYHYKEELNRIKESLPYLFVL